MASLLDRALSSAKTERGERNDRRQSGGGGRNSPYARPGADSWKHDKYADNDSAPAARPAAKGSLAARLGGGGEGAAGGKSAKLVIKNLHYEVSERELELLFVQIGPIVAGPKIKFDRSGRSEGIAWVTYGSEEHAAQAKEAFNGAPAKGQPIEVDFDFRIDRSSERGTPAAGTLLARLNPDPARGPKFASRDSDRDREPRGGRDSRPSRGRGERGVGGERGGARGGRGAGRGGRAGGGREKKEPKTNEDLDKELEAFMKQPEGSAKPTEVAAPAPDAAPAPEAVSGGDVEMS
ncbi:hypothetical protein JCM10207_008365 [Rhodosporidiobolus poonsookiae]